MLEGGEESWACLLFQEELNTNDLGYGFCLCLCYSRVSLLQATIFQMQIRLHRFPGLYEHLGFISSPPNPQEPYTGRDPLLQVYRTPFYHAMNFPSISCYFAFLFVLFSQLPTLPSCPKASAQVSAPVRSLP